MKVKAGVKLGIVAALGLFSLAGLGMPTKGQLQKVGPVVAELMKPEVEALKAGKKTKSEVAAAAMDLVSQAEGEAAKLLLAKGAYGYYVRDGNIDKALETLKRLREIVPDMDPHYLVAVIEPPLRSVTRKKAEPLYKILFEIRTVACYRDE